MNQPWECPRCHKINAPWREQCDCEPRVSLSIKCQICNQFYKDFHQCEPVPSSGHIKVNHADSLGAITCSICNKKVYSYPHICTAKLNNDK